MTNSVKNIDMIGSVKLFFINYLNFSGRASRGEFWWAYLAYIIASFACSILDNFIGGIFYALFDNEVLLNTGFFNNILIVFLNTL